MAKPRVFVARAVFPEILERLGRHFETSANLVGRLIDGKPQTPLNAEVLAGW